MMKKVTIDFFDQAHFLSNLKAAPDGSCAAYLECQCRDEGYAKSLFLHDGKKNRRLSSEGVIDYVWEDSQTLLFSAHHRPGQKEASPYGEQTDLYRIKTNGGEAQFVIRLPLAIEQMVKLQDDQLLVTAQIRKDCPDFALLSEKERESVMAQRKAEEDYQVVTESPFVLDGSGFIEGTRSRLFLVHLSEGKIEALSEPLESVSQFACAAGQVLMSVKQFDVVRGEQDGLVCLDLESRQRRCLIPQGQLRIRQIGWHQGKAVFFASENKTFGTTENPKLYQLDLQTGQRSCLLDTQEHIGSSVVMTDVIYGSGRQVLFTEESFLAVHTDRYADEILSISEAGCAEVLRWPGAVQAIEKVGDQLWLIGLKDQNLQELYRWDAPSNSFHPLTHFHDALMAETEVAKPEHFVLDRNGYTLDGWILKPVDFDETRRYPAILDIHGGPKTAYGEVFFHEMQYWAARGYLVFFCNPTGSDGKGDTFADLRGRYGQIDYEDLMAFTDAVLERVPQIDCHRIGVTGGSYGGYMTNWIIGHTDRFAAAASQRSIANWVSMIGTDDCGFTFDADQMDADPWKDMLKIWDQSPLQFADKVKTPTVFIHSFEDYSCPIQEGMQMYNAIVHHGVPARMCLFKGESHGLSRIGKRHHRIRRIQEMTDWFDHYLKENADA